MTLKTAALAPIPRASVRTARELKPGRLSQVRRARRTSWKMDSMIDCEATSMPGSRPELARTRSSGCPFLDSERTRPVVQLLGEPDFESAAHSRPWTVNRGSHALTHRIGSMSFGQQFSCGLFRHRVSGACVSQ